MSTNKLETTAYVVFGAMAALAALRAAAAPEGSVKHSGDGAKLTLGVVTGLAAVGVASSRMRSNR